MPTFEELRAGYSKQLAEMKITRPAEVDAIARRLIGYRSRYEAVAKTTGVPWFFIAALHMRESSADFKTHLHNGDPLSARTTHVPANRPVRGKPPFTWEESALDALQHDGLVGITDWTPERMCYVAEKFNGWGYRNRGVPSAYVWSFSSIYRGGKYVADGQWSPSAIDRQCGVIPIVRRIQELAPAQGPVSADVPAQAHRGASTVADWLMACVGACVGLFKGKPATQAAPADFASRVAAAMRLRGDKIATGPGELNLFFVRGMSIDRKPNGNPFDNRFNDYCGVLRVTPEGVATVVAQWPCTIDPGKRYVFQRIHPAGGASIKVGQYFAWVVRYHNGDHEALCQDGGQVTVTSDGDENGPTKNDSERTGHFGINIHGPGTAYGDRLLTDIGPVSAGCLVVPSMPMQRERMRVMKQDPRYLKNKAYVFGASIFDAKDVA